MRSDQESLSTWRNFTILAIPNVSNEYSEQTVNAETVLILGSVHLSKGTFSDISAQMVNN